MISVMDCSDYLNEIDLFWNWILYMYDLEWTWTCHEPLFEQVWKGLKMAWTWLMMKGIEVNEPLTWIDGHDLDESY